MIEENKKLKLPLWAWPVCASFALGIFIEEFGFLEPYLIVDWIWLAFMSAAVSLVSSILLSLIFCRRFSNSERKVKAIVGFIILSFIFLVPWSRAALYQANIIFDKGAPSTHRQTIAGKYWYPKGGGPGIWMNHWKHDGATFTLSSSPRRRDDIRSIFDKANQGDILEIVTRPGFLNCEWIESFKLSTK